MAIDQHELIERYGEAASRGNAALFVGAGLSAAANLPGWGALLGDLRKKALVPDHHDYPLVAEYIAQNQTIGRDVLDHHILTEIVKAGAAPTSGHKLISQLPITEIWTTNYDQLLEKACPGSDIAIEEDHIRSIGTARRTIIKMHGSVNEGPPPKWARKPVITRTDYETYEAQRPRTWALLRATYLSRTFLFLGFSFTDPNIEILLSLARKNQTAVGDRHLAVLRKPIAGSEQLTLHNLRVRDLEESGMQVCEVNDFDEIEPLLEALVRRTRPKQLFISGSAGKDPSEEAMARVEGWCSGLAGRLADQEGWKLISLGGDAGWLTTRDTARIRRSENKYDPAELAFYFRARAKPPPAMDERIGSAIYTDLEREDLVTGLLDQSRALVAVQGGERTQEEIRWARERGVGVVPIAASGGAARDYWTECRQDLPVLGGQSVDPDDWERLNDSDSQVVIRAAARLLIQAMYAPSQ